jgi:hypothetical protein
MQKGFSNKKMLVFKAKIWNALNQCSNSENNEIWMKINWLNVTDFHEEAVDCGDCVVLHEKKTSVL